MLGRTHMAAGAIAGAGLATVAGTTSPYAAVLIALAAAGALLPDLDHQGSRLSRVCRACAPLLGLAACLWWVHRHAAATNGAARGMLAVGALVTGAVYLLPLAVSRALDHRGPTHSLLLWAALAISGAVFYRGPYSLCLVAVAAGAAIGGCVPDAMTLAGAPLLWPVARRRVWILPAGWRMRTGGSGERVLLVVLSGCVVYLLARMLAGT